MAEHIDNNETILASGGHRWVWGESPVAGKTLRTIATTGAARITFSSGERPVTITGLLKASGADRAAVDSGLDGLEAAIEALRLSGKQCCWEDDCGRSGDGLAVISFRCEQRTYDRVGGEGLTWRGWTQYRIEAIELKGRPAAGGG